MIRPLSFQEWHEKNCQQPVPESAVTTVGLVCNKSLACIHAYAEYYAREKKSDAESQLASISDVINTEMRESNAASEQIRTWDMESIKAGIRRLVDVNKREKTRWRKWPEEKPEVAGKYLTIDRHDAIHTNHYSTLDGDWPKYSMVVAWQPLPEHKEE